MDAVGTHIANFEAALEETALEAECSTDEIYADAAESWAWEVPEADRAEFFRRTLGYVPAGFARMTGMPATDFLAGA